MANEKLEILRFLIENQSDKFSIRKLSRIRKINYKSAYEALKKLENEGVVSLEKFGNSIMCSFNQHFNHTVFTVEEMRRTSLLKNSDFRVFYNRLKDIKFQFIVVLFGSYAKGTATKHSDIDLLIITERENEIESAISMIPLNIHPTIIKNKDFIEMARSKNFTVVSEAIKKNIILIGIEDYYRLMENVKQTTY